jgi:hypothetical protein
MSFPIYATCNWARVWVVGYGFNRQGQGFFFFTATVSKPVLGSTQWVHEALFLQGMSSQKALFNTPHSPGPIDSHGSDVGAVTPTFLHTRTILALVAVTMEAAGTSEMAVNCYPTTGRRRNLNSHLLSRVTVSLCTHFISPRFNSINFHS